jgi:hypothetical protein
MEGVREGGKRVGGGGKNLLTNQKKRKLHGKS